MCFQLLRRKPRRAFFEPRYSSIFTFAKPANSGTVMLLGRLVGVPISGAQCEEASLIDIAQAKNRAVVAAMIVVESCQ